MRHKPGYKTTEFWLTILSVIGTWAGAIEEVLPPKFAAMASATMVSAYAIARGLRKSDTKKLQIQPMARVKKVKVKD